MTNLSIVEALGQIAREKNVDREMVVQTLKDALVSAAKRRYGNTENYFAEVDPQTGAMEVAAHMRVVEEVEEPSAEFSLEDALEIDASAQIGSIVIKKTQLCRLRKKCYSNCQANTNSARSGSRAGTHLRRIYRPGWHN